MNYKNKHICNNCGNRGHFFKHCRLPISSFGIILFRNNRENIVEYLMICRKKTFGYIDFISGNYAIQDYQYVLNMFKQMTIQEKTLIQNNDFDTLWKELWKPLVTKIDKFSIHNNKNTEVSNAECIPKTKFNFIKENSLSLILQNTSSINWKEPEWEFPKGRRNYKEMEYQCALRETMEETGYDFHLFNHLPNSNIYSTFDELFIGSNNKKYRHAYYIMSIDYEKSLIKGEFDTSEVSYIDWKTFDDCHTLIRPYNVEKKNVLARVHSFIKEQLPLPLPLPLQSN